MECREVSLVDWDTKTNKYDVIYLHYPRDYLHRTPGR